jgi:secreted trypsin-like serine protease
MTFLRSLTAAAALLILHVAPSQAVVGGHDADPGAYPAVAEITFGPFLCTGTLISPTWVLSAGHCSSITGALVATPASYLPALITVRIGGVGQDDGERVPVNRVQMHPDYLLTSGYDVSLLQLTRASSMAPSRVAAAGERSLWDPGDLETIVGWGATEEGGNLPDRLQEAQVPITGDAYCAGAYDDFDPLTMICAGFPEGGVDSCQGDSGGPMFGRTNGGELRVVGSTSFGEGCAREGKPGVYARVADAELREWIRSHVPDGVSNATEPAGGTTTAAEERRAKRHAARGRKGKRRMLIKRAW